MKSKQPLPKKAKKVFSGVIFDVYQWQQKMFDGSLQTFEKLKRPDTVVAIPTTKDKKIILVTSMQPGKFMYFGTAAGRVDPGETPLKAAKRELIEETGYTSNELIHWFSYQPVIKIEWTIHFYIAKNCKKIGDVKKEPGEKFKLKFVTFAELVSLVLSEKFDSPEITMEILKGINKPIRLTKFKKHLFS